MSWRMARSLEVLRAELNLAAPRRSKVSDGGIGDAAHATRDSDHNPWVTVAGVGIVRARDFTHDPAGGLDCHQLARRLAILIHRGDHPALGPGAYVIWNRRILSRDRRWEGWRPYTLGNPHTRHLHLSVARDRRGFDATDPWGVMAPEREDDDDMPTASEVARALLDEPLNPGDPSRGTTESADVTVREVLKGLAVLLAGDPRTAAFMARAQESRETR